MVEQYAETRIVDDVVVTHVCSDEVEEKLDNIVAQLSRTDQANHQIIILVPCLESICDSRLRDCLYKTIIKTLAMKSWIEIWYYKKDINNLDGTSRYEYTKQVV